MRANEREDLTTPSGLLLPRGAIGSIAGAYLVMGLVVSSYGPLLEHLTHRFSVSLPVAGATIPIHFAGAFAGVVVAMWSMQRLDARVTLLASTALVGAGCFGVGVAPGFPVFVASILVIGFGFGGLDLGLNQAIAYSEGARRTALLNALNGVYSAGAVAGPVLVAAVATQHFTLLFAAIGALALCAVPGQTGVSGRLPSAAGRPGRPEPLVLVFVAAFVLYVGLENGIGGWMTTHLEGTGLRSAVAAGFTSAFWLALMAGRVLMPLMPAHIPESRIVMVASGVAAVALIAASVGAFAPLAYVVAGLALAPIFPTGIVWLARLRPSDSSATSWLYPAAAIGGVAGPGAIGLVIAGFGVGWTPVVLAAVAVAMSFAFISANRAASRPTS